MSDFPKRGSVQETRAWLSANGFRDDELVGWNADALIGADKGDILLELPAREARRLWGLLNTAKQTSGNHIHISTLMFLSSTHRGVG